MKRPPLTSMPRENLAPFVYRLRMAGFDVTASEVETQLLAIVNDARALYDELGDRSPRTLTHEDLEALRERLGFDALRFACAYMAALKAEFFGVANDAE